MSKIPGPDNVLWHFIAGHPLDGHYRTDARFWRRGRKALGKVEPRRWSYLAGAERLLWRLVTLCGPPAVGWQYWTHPTRTALLGAVLAALGAILGGWRGWRSYRRHEMTSKYVRPLHAVLSPLLGLPATTRAADYIAVPPAHRTREDSPVVIGLPKTFNPSPANKTLITDAAMSKFPRMNDDNTDAIFHMVGNPVLHLKMAPQPPDSVPWADHLELMESLKPGQIFVGCGARSKPYVRDFTKGDLVHGGFSVNTGGGKSSAVIGWLSQLMHTDPRIMATFLDPKQSALPTCLVGIPGYRLANNPDNVPEMWDEIERFEREMDRRRAARLEDPTLEFPLMFLVLDELSEFADMTRETWEYVRENPEQFGYEGTVPKRAPIWRSIARILRMGREFGCRVLVFTQRLDNASTGGIGLRDLLGWRGLGRFRKNQWMMLIGTMPVPKSINRVGRWIYSDGETEKWVQNVYGTDQEYRDWASAGRRGEDTHAGHTADDDTSPGDQSESVKWDVKGLEAGAEYVGLTLGTFRKYRRDRGPIPGEGLSGRSPVWTYDTLDQFFDTGRITETDPPPVATGEGR